MTNTMRLPDNHQVILDRFIAACQTDERIVAAFLGGSYATGKVDQYSDLDLFFITTDEAYEDFLATKENFIRLLGEPLFLEDFGWPNGCLPIYADGTEADISFGRESQYKELHEGPYRILLDKKGILTGEAFPVHAPDQAKQVEVLRRQIDWFWHDLSHFIKAMGRGQLWFAYGELEVLRQMCVNLARFRYNCDDPYVAQGEPYFKIEQILPVEHLKPLEETIYPLEYHALLQASLVMFRFYQAVAPTLAEEHGLTYQVRLEQMMKNQLEELDAARLS
jgi:hypothetical protein